MRRSILMLALPILAATGSVTARAQDADSLINELKLGVFEHDASFLGHQKESGADIGLEALFQPLAFLWNPRPVVGGLKNTDGYTDQIYAGLTWTWDFMPNVLNDGDGLYAEATLGGGWNDGDINVTDPYESQHRKSLGSNWLFREDVDLGYHINPIWSVSVSWNHISNADLAVRNEGINDVGLRLGMKF